MAKDYSSLTNDVLEKVGGPDNVIGLFHCATRLRFRLKDKTKIDAEGIKSVPGVLGTVDDANGIQVVIGNDVKNAYIAIIEEHPEIAENAGGTVEDGERQQAETNPVKRLLNMLSAIVGPAIPLIMCSGLVSALLVVLTRWGGLSPESSTYAILNMAGTGGLYFLPVFVAYTSAKRFGCDIMTSVFLGALLISPALISLTEAGEFVDLFGLPVKTGNYTSTLIPSILTIWAYSHVEKLVDRFVPDAVKFVFRPLVSIFIMLPVMLCVTAPLGNYVGTLLNDAMAAINGVAPWASVLVIGCLAPLLVLTGMHLALIPPGHDALRHRRLRQHALRRVHRPQFLPVWRRARLPVQVQKPQPQGPLTLLRHHRVFRRRYRAHSVRHLRPHEAPACRYVDHLHCQRDLLRDLQRQGLPVWRPLVLHHAHLP